MGNTVPMQAIAHPNVALVKYWGKQPGTANIPATPSLSITLGALASRTRVQAAERDSVFIDGKAVADAKVLALIALGGRRCHHLRSGQACAVHRWHGVVACVVAR